MDADFTLVCQYFKFGFCSFGDHCRKHHINEICLETSCEIQNCPQRHPKTCKFYEFYKRCKFGDYCAFAHRENYQEREMTLLKDKIDKLEIYIDEKEIEAGNLNEKVEILENVVKELVERVTNITTPTKKGTKKRRKIKQHPSPCQEDLARHRGNDHGNAEDGADLEHATVSEEQAEFVTRQTNLRNPCENSDEDDDYDSITTEEILKMYESG